MKKVILILWWWVLIRQAGEFPIIDYEPPKPFRNKIDCVREADEFLVLAKKYNFKNAKATCYREKKPKNKK